MPINRIQPGPRMSQAVVHGDLVYTAGQVDNSVGDVAGQTRAILNKIDNLLSTAGSDKSSVLSANIWLSEMSTFTAMNDVWEKWISKDNPPARATVESKLAGPEYKVEIAVIAAIANGK